MYLRSLDVVALCTAFVAGFAVVLNYERSAVTGNLNAGLHASQTSCQASGGKCDSFSITSVTMREENYSSELGPGGYVILVFRLNPSGASSIDSLELFVNNSSAGTVQGPFEPGVSGVLNITLPATISVTRGMTYSLAVEGFYGNGSTVWQTVRVTAQ